MGSSVPHAYKPAQQPVHPKNPKYIWVIQCQLTQNSELFSVHVMAFLEKIHVKTSIKFTRPCKIVIALVQILL